MTAILIAHSDATQGDVEIIAEQLKTRLANQHIDTKTAGPEITTLLVHENSGQEQVDELFKQINMPYDAVVVVNPTRTWGLMKLEMRYINTFPKVRVFLYDQQRRDLVDTAVSEVEKFWQKLLIQKELLDLAAKEEEAMHAVRGTGGD